MSPSSMARKEGIIHSAREKASARASGRRAACAPRCMILWVMLEFAEDEFSKKSEMAYESRDRSGSSISRPYLGIHMHRSASHETMRLRRKGVAQMRTALDRLCLIGN